MSNRTEYARTLNTNVEAHPEGIELTTDGLTLIIQGSPAELANLASDMLDSIATLVRQQHEQASEEAARECGAARPVGGRLRICRLPLGHDSEHKGAPVNGGGFATWPAHD